MSKTKTKELAKYLADYIEQECGDYDTDVVILAEWIEQGLNAYESVHSIE